MKHVASRVQNYEAYQCIRTQFLYFEPLQWREHGSTCFTLRSAPFFLGVNHTSSSALRREAIDQDERFILINLTNPSNQPWVYRLAVMPPLRRLCSCYQGRILSVSVSLRRWNYGALKEALCQTQLLGEK